MGATRSRKSNKQSSTVAKTETGPPQKSEYELEREANIARNQMVMESLGLIKTPIVMKKRAPPSKRKREPSSDPPRRSTRLSSGSDTAALVALPEDFVEPASTQRSIQQHNTTCSREDLDTLIGEDDDDDALISAAPYLGQALSEKEPKYTQKKHTSYAQYLSAVQSFRLLDAAKLTKERGYSLKFHPQHLLLAAGDKRGTVALWNLRDANEYTCVQRFSQLHSRPVTSLTWTDKNTLVSAGFDSFVRRTDFSEERSIILADLEKVDDVDMMLHAALAHDGSLLAASHQCGQLSLLDPRISTTKLICKPIQAHDSKCHHVDLKTHRLATSGNDGQLKVFDLRSLTSNAANKKKLNPLFSFSHHRAVRGCALSSDGRSIVSVSYDDTVLLTDNIDSPKQQVLIKHRNDTGRWLTPFKPCLDPHAPEPIVVLGSMDRPRAIDLLAFPRTSLSGSSNTNNKSTRATTLASSLVHKLHDNDQSFKAVTSIHDVHPAIHLIAGINNSGYVSIFGSPSGSPLASS